MGKLLPILEYPAPSLTEPCVEVQLDQIEELQELIDDMIYTMFYHQGVGLAAPQVGHNLRLFVLDQRPINGNPIVNPWVFINPEIMPASENEVLRPEGCLSFPGQYAEVARSEWVKVRALDRRGEGFSLDATNNHLFSVALQHENDHLDGKLMLDVADKKGKKALEKWAKGRRR